LHQTRPSKSAQQQTFMNILGKVIFKRISNQKSNLLRHLSSNIMADRLSLFQGIGLTEQKAKETIKNKALADRLENLVSKTQETRLKIEKPLGVLLYSLGSCTVNDKDKLHYVLDYVIKDKIISVQQLNAAVDFMKHAVDLSKVVQTEFELNCGVDVKYNPEQIENAVEVVLTKHVEDIKQKRYQYNTGMLLGEVSKSLKWVDMKKVKSEIDMQLLDILGPKTEADKNPPKKAATKTKDKKDKPKKEVKEIQPPLDLETILKMIDPKTIYLSGESTKFHKPGENHTTEGYVTTANTMRLLDEHLKEYGHKVRTRFPPEPNGILHIGHAKAINFNFGFADANEGVTYLRYDDTNPEKEEEKFFKGIREMVEWLGFKPYKITHASDQFEKLHQYAVDLIKRDKAYICHQRHEELKGHNPPPSPWRNRPVSESLQLFDDMKHGKLDEGEATLRMKIVMEDGKMDPVAYRIKFTPHHRTGNKWCIYPTYDFTHCLNDSLEHITHSLCTKEFQARRSSYYWLCNSLDAYCPVQWEYSRLNLNYTVVSKRKIGKLIDAKIVEDWDDPRLFTLTALRRRGVPPEAINLFCAKIGVTMSQTTLDPSMLESCVRDVLNVTAHRALAVLEPLRVVIANLPKENTEIEVPNIPSNPKAGTHKVPFGRVIYIERSDFKEKTDKDYKRLAGDQTVGLRHAGQVLTVTDIKKDEHGHITEVHTTCESSTSAKKPKAFIQWVSDEKIKCTVKIYHKLFLHPNPEDPKEVPGGFLSDINPDSLETYENAYVDVSVKNAPVLKTFQFERIGFFCVDKDTTESEMVFNQTIALKEDSAKK